MPGRTNPENDLYNLLKKGASITALPVIAVVLLVLLGWQLDIEFLKLPIGHLVAMNPMTALCFIFSGIALWFLKGNEKTKNLVAAQLLCISIALIAGIRLLSFISGHDLGIDYWLFTQKMTEETSGIISNRMAPNTAFNFVLLAFALLLSAYESGIKKTIANYLALAILTVGLFSLIGYLYSAKEFYGLLRNLPMAVHTAICFILMALSILFLNNDRGFMRTFTSEYYGGIIARLLIPSVIIVPVLLGYTRLWFYWRWPVSVELGVSALITFIIISFYVLVWYLASALNKSDAARVLAEEELKLFNKGLEAAVAERTDKLHITEKQFRQTLDNMLEGVQMHDFNWRYIYVNDALVKYSTYKKEELLGHTLQEKYPGIEQSDLFKVLQRVMNERMPEHLETEFTFPNGTKADFELSIQPIPEGIFILLVDITERKKAEELRILFTSIVNSSDDAILSKTLDGVVTSWNHGAERVFGYTAEEIMGKHISLLIPGHLRNEENKIIEKIRKGEVVDHYETERIRKDGKIIIVSLTISPIKDSRGKIIGASKISRDITGQKEAEQKIIKANRLYAFISAINQSIVHITDEKVLMDKACDIAVETGKFKMAWLSRIDENRKVSIVSFKGDKTDAQKILKQSGWDCDDPAMRDTPIGKVLTTGKYAFNNDVQNDPALRAWKEEFIKQGIFASISLPIFKFGKVTGFLGLHAGEKDFFDEQEIRLLEEATGDISFALENFEKEKLREQAEQEIIKLNKELEMRVEQRTGELLEAYQQLESFSYTVSHDLRSPLQVISSYASLFSRKYGESLNGDAQRLLQGIKDYIQQMAQLIEDLLNFSSMGKTELMKKQVDMNELMLAVIEELKSGDRSIKTGVKLHDLKPASGDPGLLYQVCINLVSNALKYSKKTGAPEIEIGLKEMNGDDVYFVKDNGAGFDMNKADKLFKAFQRLHKTSEFEGSGVGLALVHAIITKHGGRIWAEAKVDEGATFYFTLPVA